MSRYPIARIVASCFLIPIMLSFLPLAGLADSLEEAGIERLVLIEKGGLLYDNWFEELRKESPKATHPLYTANGKSKGSTTWRCKECHGWDLMGKDGAYRSGSHFSGIAGLRASEGASEQQIVDRLKGDHRYGDLMGEADLRAVAAFVSAGQVDMTRYIGADKKAKGDAVKGGRLYQTICSKCHGADGNELNFGSESKPEYVGTLADGNPWEILHKIRFGQPEEDMPSLLALPVQTQVDVLAYLQTLPVQ